MIIIILASILVITLSWLITYKDTDEPNQLKWIDLEWCGFILHIVGLTIVMGSLSIAYFSLNPIIINPIERTETWTLEQIRTTDYAQTSGAIRGGAFYVIGAMDTNSATSYKVYRKLNDTDFKLETIPSSQATIRYNDNSNDVIVTYSECPETHIRAFQIERCEPNPTRYIINVPNGSIMQKVEL